MGEIAAGLLQTLQRLPLPRRYLVAFSGGLDSAALLHALWRLSASRSIRLKALHIDHGLHPDSAAWGAHCAAFCAARAIAFEGIPLTLPPAPGESLEAAARTARYAALKARMGCEDMLLTAQHRDDQAETVLLQLLRGSGPAGLAAMPECIGFGPGWLARPLLGASREAIRRYAEAQGLSWCEDPSNADPRFDRNFLRLQVMPLLKSRWPGLDQTLSRSAAHCAEAQGLLEECAAQDLGAVLTAGFQGEPALDLAALRARSPAQQKALLRAWIGRRGLPLPNAGRLQEVLQQALSAAAERSPAIRWPGAEARRYRGLLYLMPALPTADAGRIIEWSLGEVLDLPLGLGSLAAAPAPLGVCAQAWRQGPAEVAFRRGGERCRPAPKRSRRDLKRLFQEAGVPPWLRPIWPLIYLDGRLAAVPGLWVCDDFRAAPGAPAMRLDWHRPSSC